MENTKKAVAYAYVFAGDSRIIVIMPWNKVDIEFIKSLRHSSYGYIENRWLISYNARMWTKCLRVSELINIRLEDIDSKRKLIIIRQAKGKKDRNSLLSEKILVFLR